MLSARARGSDAPTSAESSTETVYRPPPSSPATFTVRAQASPAPHDEHERNAAEEESGIEAQVEIVTATSSSAEDERSKINSVVSTRAQCPALPIPVCGGDSFPDFAFVQMIFLRVLPLSL